MSNNLISIDRPQTNLSYWEMLTAASKIAPRQTIFTPIESEHSMRVKTKGRRSGTFYSRFQFAPDRWNVSANKTLPDTFHGSALAISRKAAGCPSPLNLDVWDGAICPYSCQYCFANYFRTTLYHNFFDNVPKGSRHADLPMVLKKLDKLFNLRGAADVDGLSGEAHAISLEIPIRIGVRYENFIPKERKDGIALTVLNFLADYGYPVIIDSKSDIFERDEYLEALARNPSGAMVQLSLSSADDGLLKDLEPGAPSPTKRFATLKALNDAGVKGVARIEPFLPFLADSEGQIADYIHKAKEAGVMDVCWDAFSYSCANSSTRRLFHQRGYDFDRMFIAASDSRLMTGALLWRMMEHFRENGFVCSTYDDMNSFLNDDPWNCCHASSALKSFGSNLSSTKIVERYVMEQGGRGVSWGEFETYVEGNGGFLSDALRLELYGLWNNDGNDAYALSWLSLEPIGRDIDGLIWAFPGTNQNLIRGIRYLESVYERA